MTDDHPWDHPDCEPCRQRRAAYYRQWRVKLRQRLATEGIPAGVKHGTLHVADHYCCPCAPCRAVSDARNAARAAAKGKPAPKVAKPGTATPAPAPRRRDPRPGACWEPVTTVRTEGRAALSVRHLSGAGEHARYERVDDGWLVLVRRAA